MNNKNHLLGKESLADKMKKIKQEMDIKELIIEDKRTIPHPPLNTSPDFIKHVSKNRIEPKLFISGRLDRKKYIYTAKSLFLLSRLEDEIKAYCRGGDLVILNYLISEGLNNVKKSGKPISIEMEEFVNDIT
jgi:hypothetical protein